MSALSTFFVFGPVTSCPCSELRKGGTARVRNRSSPPSATRREDGADEEADDGVADKREYFHAVNEDKNRGKAGRYRSTIY